jgi:hypothetical protein
VSNPALVKVGEAAIAARMTPQEVERDPTRALTIAMNAMRATLALDKPNPATARGEPPHE